MKNPRYKFRQRLAFTLHARYIRLESKIHKLSYFFWECTSRCNIACLHCGSDCKTDIHPDMPADDFLKVAAEVAEVYNPASVMIVITGGEPLVRKDLEQVGLELKKMGFPWGMVSNGYAMTKERFRSLRESGLCSATISLDGMKKNHDWLRGREGSFERATEAIRMLAEEENMLFDVVTCVNRRNINELDEIKKHLINLGVARWRLFMIDPIGRAAENPELMLSDDEFVHMLQYIADNRKEGSILTSFGCDGFLGEFEANVRDGISFCRAGIHVGSVLANGDVSACPNISREFVQGNIYHEKFMDIWNQKFEVFRNRKQLKKGICEHCSVWKWCKGDGMHLHSPKHDGPFMCHYRKIYPQAH